MQFIHVLSYPGGLRRTASHGVLVVEIVFYLFLIEAVCRVNGGQVTGAKRTVDTKQLASFSTPTPPQIVNPFSIDGK